MRERFGDALELFLALIFAQALDACASATFAYVNATLFALGDEPAATAEILHNAPVHHFFVKAAEETIEGLAIAQFDGHTNQLLPRIGF